MITIVDYGVGNLNSILNMLRKSGVEALISSESKTILNSKKLILPGVGAFDYAMNKIHSSGLKEMLDQKVLREKVPVLGICLGMQLMTEGSEEGGQSGLGWIPGQTLGFKSRLSREYKIPHMGWNSVSPQKDSKLITLADREERFYFVHSYFVKCTHAEHSLGRTTHGIEFDSIIQKENIYGVQFHPEKSHKFGMKLLRKFSEI